MLPTVLWLALFLFAIGFFLYIIRGINKNIFLLKNALIWLLISIVLIIALMYITYSQMWLVVAAYGMVMYIKENVFHKQTQTKWYKTERFK